MRTSNKATILRTVFFLDISPRHSNIMADKWLNISEKYATRCVIYPLRKKSAAVLPEGTVIICTYLAA